MADKAASWVAPMMERFALRDVPTPAPLTVMTVVMVATMAASWATPTIVQMQSATSSTAYSTVSSSTPQMFQATAPLAAWWAIPTAHSSPSRTACLSAQYNLPDTLSSSVL